MRITRWSPIPSDGQHSAGSLLSRSAASQSPGFGRGGARGFSKKLRLCSRFQLVAEVVWHHAALSAPVNNRPGGEV